MANSDNQKSGFFGWFGKKKSSTETTKDDQKPRDTTQNPTAKVPLDSEEATLEHTGTQTPPLENLPDSASQSLQNEPSNSEPAQTASSHTQASLTQTSDAKATQAETIEAEQSNPPSLIERLKSGLAKTRSQFSSGLANLILGQKEIDDDLLEEVETILLMADVGVDTTNRIISDLTEKADRKELKDSTALLERLKELLLEIVEPVQAPLMIPEQKGPFVILMVGVNGVGKTTTIGKLAHQFLAQGKSVMLAAGDTFRAAAVEQLSAWGERNNVPVIAQHTGADSASVIFDAVQAATARDVDIVIADTAGRLHNKSNLMEELSKVKRVMAKVDPNAPHEVMLVVDAGTGQNALVQAIEFNKSVSLDSVTITKLDGTAKGGVVFALADKMKLPIRYIGVGESKEDLRAFDATDFVEALFDRAT